MILCVLRSGGVYDASWVDKLKRGVERNTTGFQRFVCLSDVDVDCERIPLKHDWPGWWAKIEMFNVITEPTLYLDLDTVITSNMDEFTNLPYDFAMLENFNDDQMVGSGMMWFKKPIPAVYDRFLQDPQRIMAHYERVKVGSYRGDQAFIFDTLDRQVDKIKSPSLRSYKRHCRSGLPDGTSVVCFHGRPRPTEINPDWMQKNWI